LPLIQSFPEVSIRLLACIILKKNIINLYENLQANDKNHIKTSLLEFYFNEKSSMVQKALGALIGAVATIALEDKQWPELMQVIGQQSQIKIKEGLVVLGYVLDSSGDFLTDYYEDLFLLFDRCLDQPEVRKEAMKCVCYLWQQHNFDKA